MASPTEISQITQPPLLGFGMELLNEIEPDEAWHTSLVPKPGRHLEWIFSHRDSDRNGLLEWSIEGEIFCRRGESGMDNSPRFDAATQFDATDFNAHLAHECKLMASRD